MQQLKLDIKKYSKRMSDYEIDNFIEAIRRQKITSLRIDFNDKNPNNHNPVFTKNDMTTMIHKLNDSLAEHVANAFSEGYSQGFNFGQASRNES